MRRGSSERAQVWFSTVEIRNPKHLPPLPSLLLLPATLTSYSADSAAEREDGSKKYVGDGYHGSGLRQQGGRLVAPSASSSCVLAGGSVRDCLLYQGDDGLSVSTYSLNKLHPDRGPGSSNSSASSHSVTLNLIPRPNSVAGRKRPGSLKALIYRQKQQTSGAELQPVFSLRLKV